MKNVVYRRMNCHYHSYLETYVVSFIMNLNINYGKGEIARLNILRKCVAYAVLFPQSRPR